VQPRPHVLRPRSATKYSITAAQEHRYDRLGERHAAECLPEKFSRELSGLRAEPVVKAAGGELLGGLPEVVEYPEAGTIRAMTRGRFDPPKADEDPADHLNLSFKRSDAEEQ
jgi:hypothetical protein